jgi:hypothetical protein
VTILSRQELDAVRFTPSQLDTLFAAILIDDDVDVETPMPSHITLDYNQSDLADGYRLGRQLWQDGADIPTLRRLLLLLDRQRDLNAADRETFKHIRAKLKHFRFTQALFGARHDYSLLIDLLTTALGHIQDAFKTGQRARVRTKAWTARAFLVPPLWTLMRRDSDQLVLTTSCGLRRYLATEVGKLVRFVEAETVTGAEFHSTRKVVSRQVSFHNTMMVIRPDDEHYLMSRVLAAINGLMGERHDDLVERKVSGSQDYHRDRFAILPEIRLRLQTLIEGFERSGLVLR